MLVQELIRKKRDGGTLTREEITEFVAGITDQSVTDAQIAAFCMSVFFNDLEMPERTALTRAMAESGSTLDWSHLSGQGPVLDKHSTGGVGDNVSLMLAPILAACGAYVPMISGRGLGHTGGTLDKFDSIPGYITSPDPDMMRKVVTEVGCAVVGQTADLAPADKRMYAVRDVTATVESRPLITASILSKKISAGLQGLVLDVKSGTGAFFKSHDEALMLAQALVDVANAAGLPTRAVLTDMNEPLANAAGNAVEVRNAIEFLRGEQVGSRLWHVTHALCGHALHLGGLADSPEEGIKAAKKASRSGEAAEKFAEMVVALGGPSDLLEIPDQYLADAPVVVDCPATESGTVAGMQTRDIGLAVVELGGGRHRAEDSIDHSVGLSHICNTGDKVEKGDVLCRVHAKSREDAEHCIARIQAAVSIADGVEPTPLVRDVILEPN